jgi:Uma2 family endonuclease
MAHRNGTSLLEPRARRPHAADIRRMSLDALIDLADRLEGVPVPGVTMTEAEFVDWCPETLRAEWVNGSVILMSPSNVEHDDLSTWFTTLLRTFVEDRNAGRVFHDVFVRFAGQRRRRVPDLMLVSNERLNLLEPTFLDGPPDLLIEIVSPDSQSRDRREKYLEYEKAGVREYWIVDPLSKTVEVSRLERKKFRQIEEIDGVIASSVLRGFRIKTAQLWLKPLPKVSAVLKWMNRK